MFNQIPVSETELAAKRRALVTERGVALKGVQAYLVELKNARLSGESPVVLIDTFVQLMVYCLAVNQCENSIVLIDSIRNRLEMEEILQSQRVGTS